MNRTVNSYLGVLVITLVGSMATLVIVRMVYENSFYMLASGYGSWYEVVPAL